jgi:hypothetical protein
MTSEAVAAIYGALVGGAIAGAFSLLGTLLAYRLQRRSIEHQVRYAALHERHANVLGHLHGLVVMAERTFPAWALPGSAESLNKIMGKWMDAMRELDYYYREHALWLDRSVCDRLDTFLEEYTGLAEEMTKVVVSEELPDAGDPDILTQLKQDPEIGAAYVENFEAVMGNRQRMRAAVAEIREGLANEFRASLHNSGVADCDDSERHRRRRELRG